MNNTIRVVLVVLLLVLLIGMLPAWPYSAGWGYYPSGGVGLLLILLVLIIALTGRGDGGIRRL